LLCERGISWESIQAQGVPVHKGDEPVKPGELKWVLELRDRLLYSLADTLSRDAEGTRDLLKGRRALAA